MGQHFLRDENIARKIIAAVHTLPEDVILEIGPGEGVLTKYLAGAARRLIAVEIDARAVEILQHMFPPDRVVLLRGDVLETDITRLARESPPGNRLRVVGNIPYNITSPILFHLLDHRISVVDATLMMQREVARRLVATPGTKEYGILSVFCQLYTEPRLLFDVSPNAFVPKPAVVSSVVHLVMLRAPRFALADEQLFRSMVRSVFGKRRKTLRNALRYFPAAAGVSLPPEFNLQRRAEELSLQELVALGNALGSRESSA